ncbi:MAG: hypothetical protein ACI4O0_09270 [Candidatus Limivicinus sp.]
MNMKLWSICNDLDTVATNQEAAQDAFAYILDGLDRSACEAIRGGQEASTAFIRKYQNFSRMLFLILGVMQDQSKEAQRLINIVFDVVKEDHRNEV